MFFVAGTLLVSLATILPHGSTSDRITEYLLGTHWFWPDTILGLYGIILIEGIVGMTQAPDGRLRGFKRFLLVALIPPLRMAFSPARPNHYVWYPKRGKLPVGKDSASKVELSLAVPMLLLTLAILPIFAVELIFTKQIEANPSLEVALHAITAMIWLAFALEFCLLLGVAENKLDFCRRHWVNIVIIILPLVAFLRILRLTRLAKVVRAGKMLRMYRLRGIYVRALRVAVLLNLVDRLMQRNPRRYLEGLELKIAEREEELAELQEKAEQFRKRIAELELEEARDLATKAEEGSLP